MVRPNITEALEWILSEDDNCIIKASHGPLIASSMGDDNSAYYASEAEAIANAQAISAVPKLLNEAYQVYLMLRAHPEYRVHKNQEFIDRVNGLEEALEKAGYEL